MLEKDSVADNEKKRREELLVELIKQRASLGENIAALQYELENPLPSINHDKVNVQVKEWMEESKAMEERFYQKLVEKEREGILNEGEVAVLARRRGEEGK